MNISISMHYEACVCAPRKQSDEQIEQVNVDHLKENASFDYLQTTLRRFGDGPIFLSQVNWVDVAYGPFVEKFQIVFFDVHKNDITNGRPKLATYIEELGKIDAYKPTNIDPEEFVEVF